MKKKKLLSGLLAAVLSLSLAACGGGASSSGQSGGNAASSKEHVVTDQPVQIGSYDTADPSSDIYMYLQELREVDGRIYTGGSISDDSGQRNFLASFLPDGSDYKETVLTGQNDLYITAMTIGDDASSYICMARYDEEASEGATDAYYEPDIHMSLVKYDTEGKEAWSVPLNEGPDASENFYIQSMASVGDRLYVADEKGISILSCADGSPAGTISGLPNSEFERILVPVTGGSLYLYQMSDRGGSLYPIDESGKLGSSVSVPTSNGNWIYRYCGGPDGRFYGCTENGIYSFAPGDTELAQTVSFVNSDILVNQTDRLVPLSDGTFFISCYGNEGSMEYHLLTPVDPESVKDKKEITVGVLYTDDTVRRQITAFNRENQDYRLVIRDYAEQMDDSDDAYEKVMEKFNADIISGSGPDVVILQEGSRVSGYTHKGVFADLKDYWDADPDLSSAEYLDNVLNSMNPEGTRYVLVPSFTLQGVAARTADLKGKEFLTFEEVLQLAKDKGIDPKNIFGQTVREGFIYDVIARCGRHFIDPETGTCSFDNPEFAAMLTYAASLPSYEDVDDEDWEKGQVMWREGTALLHTVYLSEMEEYQLEYKGYFGEPITIIGFPCAENVGPSFYPSYYLAVSADCKDKDAAWEFVKSFFTEDYQDKIQWNFPVRLSSLDKILAKSMEQKYYTDENGNKVPENSTWGIGGNIEVEITPMTKEETDIIRNLVTGLSSPSFYDNEISAIIQEETSAFLAGSKTAQETASIIQSRVQIYLSENR